jgi:hypothetical protein
VFEQGHRVEFGEEVLKVPLRCLVLNGVPLTYAVFSTNGICHGDITLCAVVVGGLLLLLLFTRPIDYVSLYCFTHQNNNVVWKTFYFLFQLYLTR